MKNFFENHARSLLLIGIVALTIFLFLTLTANFYYTSDAAKYILLGRSIITGEGYTSIWEFNPIPHHKYAPLLPLLISPFSFLTSDNILSIKILMKILAILSVVIIFFYCYKKKIGVLASALITSVYIIPIQFFLFSEGPNPLHLYTFISFSALYWLEKFHDEKSHIIRNGIIAAFFSLLCFFSKGNGLALIFAGYTVFFFMSLIPSAAERRKKAIIFLIITLIPLLFWFGRSYTTKTTKSGYGHSYTSEILVKDIGMPLEEAKVTLEGFKDRVKYNLELYMSLSVVSTENFFLQYLTAYFIIFGLALSIKKKSFIAPLYFLFYFLLILIWPWPAYRMYLPIRPLSAFFACLGVISHMGLLKGLLEARGHSDFFEKTMNHKKLISITAISILLLFLAYTSLENTRLSKTLISQKSQNHLDFIQASNIANKNTEKNAKFYTSSAPAFFLYSDRPSSYPPLTRKKSEIIKRFSTDKPDYIVLHQWGNNFAWLTLSYFIRTNPEKFKKIFQNNSSAIYKVSGFN